jgi:hypothetical protein
MRTKRQFEAAVALSLIAFLGTACTSTGHANHAAHQVGASKREVHVVDAGEKPGKGDKKAEVETPDDVKYKKLKADANAKAKTAKGVSSRSAGPLTSSAPTLVLNKPGVADPGWYPTDANGARGGNRYVEVINNTVGYYSANLGLVTTGTTFDLAGTTSGYVGDPEVIYDPGSNKFFYTMIDQDASGSWRLDYGFSKSSSPSSAADFCHYFMPSSGTTLPDYPRLGASKSFLMIGTNNYANGSNYVDSSVYWATKPTTTALTTCPDAPTNGRATGFQFTPVPSHQTDPVATGYILSSSWSGGSSLVMYKVTRSAAGAPVFSAGTSIPVNAYSIAADADQPGTTDQLSTDDARLFEVVQSFDNGVGVLWTAHNIYGGDGSAARCYEISTTGSVLQQGTVTNPSLDYYYPTISSDRAFVSSTKKGFGSNMVMGFNQSSSTVGVGIDLVSEQGRTGLSPVVVATPGDGSHISCGGTCRWGDRSSANPSLSAPLTNTTGRVWLSQSIVQGGSYGTRNLQVAP